MVHALKECRRVLRPGGLLIDLRPFPGNWPLSVVAGGDILPAGVLDDSKERPDDEASNAAIEEAVRLGWFSRERTATFRFAWYWDSLAELEAYIEERWKDIMLMPVDTRAAIEQMMAAAGPGARLQFSRGVLIGRYRRLE